MTADTEFGLSATMSMELKEEVSDDSVKETECILEFLTQPYPSTTGNTLFCNTTWDGVSCWPTTAGGARASVPCFGELNGVRYDITSNASRYCNENGTWSHWSNYRSCKPLKLHDDELMQVLWDVKEAATIYYVGYSFSLIALTLALFIFLYFKDLRCLRNTVHTNLLTTHLLIDITWILTATLQSSQNATAAKIACFLVILLTYLMGTNFFWMFVEGLYLFVLVVKTFSVDKVNFKIYVMVGWGVPALVASAWAGVKGAVVQSVDEPLVQRSCPWQNRDYYDYIFICPVVFVLLINMVFLSKIMWVLITKLRASNTMESRQYRKAAKALLVLIPLLGVTYILVLATPTDPTAEVVFTYIQATLLSIQGFIVAVLYCFLNGEVQNSLKTHWERWRTQSSVGKGKRHPAKVPFAQKGETLRLYNSNKVVRESCTSFTTTTIVVNIQNKNSNPGIQISLPPQDMV